MDPSQKPGSPKNHCVYKSIPPASASTPIMDEPVILSDSKQVMRLSLPLLHWSIQWNETTPTTPTEHTEHTEHDEKTSLAVDQEKDQKPTLSKVKLKSALKHPHRKTLLQLLRFWKPKELSKPHTIKKTRFELGGGSSSILYGAPGILALSRDRFGYLTPPSASAPIPTVPKTGHKNVPKTVPKPAKKDAVLSKLGPAIKNILPKWRAKPLEKPPTLTPELQTYQKVFDQQTHTEPNESTLDHSHDNEEPNSDDSRDDDTSQAVLYTDDFDDDVQKDELTDLKYQLSSRERQHLYMASASQLHFDSNDKSIQ